jgi:hypothetical protein
VCYTCRLTSEVKIGILDELLDNFSFPSLRSDSPPVVYASDVYLPSQDRIIDIMVNIKNCQTL